MTRTRANWPKRRTDERQFRFRVRFTRPPGDGIWSHEPLYAWLDERLGRNMWAMYPDTWDGHGTDTYALHFNDHTVIPDLLEFWDLQRVASYSSPLFQASLGRNVVAAIRAAIVDLQGRIVEAINARRPTVSWTMGACTFLPDAYPGNYDVLRVRQVGLLGQIDTALRAVPAAGMPLTVVLEDEHRGAVEVGITMLQDLRPVPTETVECLRLLLDALDQVKV